jgi:hypothetical protein
MKFPLEKFKVLQIEIYDDSKDPTEHIETYLGAFDPPWTLDEIAWRAFPYYL